MKKTSKVQVDDIVFFRKRSNSMHSKQPWDFKPALSAERLNFIAKNLWDVYYDVMSQLVTADDCNWTRSTAFFGRCRQRLIQLSSPSPKQQDWLKLTNPRMDVTVEIEGVPFRFFKDDHENPKKKGFWRRNDCDQLFAPNELEPVIFRFIVEPPIADDDELEIYFIGYNSLEEAICKWRYGKVGILHSTDQERPQAVQQPAAPIDIPDLQQGDADNKESLG
ncbi:MAG: hypothetical protein JNM52_02985 [Betaproteobacteria bacterium]|nr:hypothetical protein [Betaproteobacteria bacterium]